MGPNPADLSILMPASAIDPKMPDAELSLKQQAVSAANWLSLIRTTRPGHWDRCVAAVQYASAMSWTAAWEPGGRSTTIRYITLKVPQVEGKLSEMI